MNLFRVNFPELYDRHLCRHSQFGINVIHIVVVMVIYLCLYALVHLFFGFELLLGIAACHLAILALNVPLKVLLGTAAFLAVVILLVISLPAWPAWAYALAIYPLYKIQAWSHKVYDRERDMTEFNKKYRKGVILFVLLSVYEVPILLHYLVFDNNNWLAWHLFRRGRKQAIRPNASPADRTTQCP